MHPSWDVEALDDALERAAGHLRSAERVATMTGAGVSAESGLATFRGAGGLWEGHRVEDVATPFAFRRDPELVWRFYNMRRANLREARPNPGHDALVKLEKGKYTETPVQTQFGWHVIRLDDVRSTQFPPFEQVRQQIFNLLRDVGAKGTPVICASTDHEQLAAQLPVYDALCVWCRRQEAQA